VSALIYLAVAVLISVVGSLLLALRHRRPRSLDAGIREFEQQIRALAPEPPDEFRGPRAG
jgi:hypothetical protein